MSYALVQDGKVIQVSQETFEVHPSYRWVKAAADVSVGDVVSADDTITKAVKVVTRDNINEERARRLAAGFSFDFGPGRGTHVIGTTPEDMAGWNEVSTLAQVLKSKGMTAAKIDVKTETDGVIQVTASEWEDVLLAAAFFRQPIWNGSFALKAMDPIPSDYQDDKYWS